MTCRRQRFPTYLVHAGFLIFWHLAEALATAFLALLILGDLVSILFRRTTRALRSLCALCALCVKKLRARARRPRFTPADYRALSRRLPSP